MQARRLIFEMMDASMKLAFQKDAHPSKMGVSARTKVFISKTCEVFETLQV